MIITEIRDYLNELDIEATIFDNPSFDGSIIGLSTDDKIVYSLEKMVRELSADDDIDEEEALEFIEYNTLRTLPYIDADTRPIIVDYGEFSEICGELGGDF